jgi:hypothetical protein
MRAKSESDVHGGGYGHVAPARTPQ